MGTQFASRWIDDGEFFLNPKSVGMFFHLYARAQFSAKNGRLSKSMTRYEEPIPEPNTMRRFRKLGFQPDSADELPARPASRPIEDGGQDARRPRQPRGLSSYARSLSRRM